MPPLTPDLVQFKTPRLEARLTCLLPITLRHPRHAHAVAVFSRAYRRDVWHMPHTLGLVTVVDMIAHHDFLHKCSAAPAGAVLSRLHHRLRRPWPRLEARHRPLTLFVLSPTATIMSSRAVCAYRLGLAHVLVAVGTCNSGSPHSRDAAYGDQSAAPVGAASRSSSATLLSATSVVPVGTTLTCTTVLSSITQTARSCASARCRACRRGVRMTS